MVASGSDRVVDYSMNNNKLYDIAQSDYGSCIGLCLRYMHEEGHGSRINSVQTNDGDYQTA